MGTSKPDYDITIIHLTIQNVHLAVKSCCYCFSFFDELLYFLLNKLSNMLSKKDPF